MMDPPDVSDGINERVSISDAQRNRTLRNQASLKARKKEKAGIEVQKASAAMMLLQLIWFYPGSAVTYSGSQSAR